MKVQIFIEAANQVWYADVHTAEFTETEKQKMQAHAEPEIDVGGDFTGTKTRPGEVDPVEVTFTLPNELRRMATDFPAKKGFDIRDDEDSDVKAAVWADTIYSRLVTARTTLMNLKEPFIGETTYTIL